MINRFQCLLLRVYFFSFNLRPYILAKLRAGLGARRVIRPAYGELCFFEHEFKSPAARDCVFEAGASTRPMISSN
jgi:hypothetical protein